MECIEKFCIIIMFYQYATMRILKLITLVSLLLVVTSITTSAAVYKGGRSGVGALYSSEGIFTGTFDVQGLTLGVFGKNWTTAEKRKAGTSNYGQTRIGDVDSIYGLDIGYSYPVFDFLRIGSEVSGGVETKYGKYRDARFSEGYYISEEDEEWIVGVGLTAAIPVTENIEIAINGNTIKGLGGGILFRFK